jgi:hypothetical protein
MQVCVCVLGVSSVFFSFFPGEGVPEVSRIRRAAPRDHENVGCVFLCESAKFGDFHTLHTVTHSLGNPGRSEAALRGSFRVTRPPSRLNFLHHAVCVRDLSLNVCVRACFLAQAGDPVRAAAAEAQKLRSDAASAATPEDRRDLLAAAAAGFLSAAMHAGRPKLVVVVDPSTTTTILVG